MDMDILDKLFGSGAKVRILKLFLMNPDRAFDPAMVAERAMVSIGITRKELRNLDRIGFIKRQFFTKEIKKQKNRTIVSAKKKTPGWTLEKKFPYMETLESFLSNVNPFKHKDVIEKISRTGKVNLLIISGVFIKYEDARVDLLVVGDGIKMGALEDIVKTIESEMGEEVRYTVFETSEFNYRLSLFDKLIRDILDFPHEKIINKLGI